MASADAISGGSRDAAAGKTCAHPATMPLDNYRHARGFLKGAAPNVSMRTTPRNDVADRVACGLLVGFTCAREVFERPARRHRRSLRDPNTRRRPENFLARQQGFVAGRIERSCQCGLGLGRAGANDIANRPLEHPPMIPVMHGRLQFECSNRSFGFRAVDRLALRGGSPRPPRRSRRDGERGLIDACK